MSSIKIGALNCRGLADELKRKDFFLRCQENYDISILVDTHCKKENENQWRQEWRLKVILVLSQVTAEVFPFYLKIPFNLLFTKKYMIEIAII